MNMDPSNVENVSSDEDHEQQPVQKKRKGRSKVWDEFFKFTTEDNIKKARCNHCKKELCADTNRNGTSALKRHLNSCKKHPSKTKGQSNIFLKKNDNGEGESSVRNWKFSAENTRRAISEMVVLDELPFASVEHEGFKRLMETICPNFKVPTRFTVARDCGGIFLEEKGKLKSFFAKSKTRVSLTTDTWTSVQTISYMCVTAHFLDDNWVLHKRIISFKPIYNHKGEEIARLLLQCIREWEIDSICTITTDNAAANIVAMSILKDRLDNVLFDGRYIHVRCMAHIINLIVKDGLQEMGGVVDRIRNAVRYIRHSPQRLEKFKTCVQDLKIETKALLSLDCPTRWNSTYDMLHRAQKLEKAFDEFDMRDSNYSKDLGDKIPRVTDWMCARDLAKMLELFKRKTTKVSASTQVIVNEYFTDMMDIQKHIRKLMVSLDLDYKVASGKMQDKCDKYWRKDKHFNKLLYCAAILDPRSKVRVIGFGFQKMFIAERNRDETDEQINKKVELVVTSITEEFELLFKQYELRNETCASNKVSQTEINVDSASQGDEEDFFAEFKADGGFAMYDTKSELQKYLDEKEEPNYAGFNILIWWKNASSKYPTLAKMAKDILAIPLSSVASESAFSTGGRVIDTYRSSLSTPLVEALICTQDWIRKSSKAINTEEDLTNFDEIGKELSDRMEPSGAHAEMN